ncbi:hypothetical protein QBC40DRAFT_209361 [Triangularia verruculosa]|uniref:Uncharacterized protein n=1 Tax=Triangularia verruculosa TaxID=2587418 RepID=A0AAN6X9P4_9PEZI|nr:hypothetical protein QBC40DRAFT_209361 [Triangularia verruculosa]
MQCKGKRCDRFTSVALLAAFKGESAKKDVERVGPKRGCHSIVASPRRPNLATPASTAPLAHPSTANFICSPLLRPISPITDTMPFSPPPDTREKDTRWQAFANVGCRDSRPLWTTYWKRFNTITIPLLDEDAFFSDALAAAKVARNREHLEELLDKKSKERRAELERVVDKIPCVAVFDKNPFSPEAAWDAVDKLGRSGSLDSFIQLVSGIVWGWEDGQLGEHRPRRVRSRSPFTSTETQEMPHMHSPYPTVSDNWDLLHQDMGPSVTELPASPGQRQLPPPTSPPCSTMARESPTMSQSVNGSPTDLVLPPSPSDTRPSLTASHTTPTTPPDPPSDGGVDIPQSLLFTQSLSPQREGGQEPGANASRGSPRGKPKPRSKRQLHELEGSDLENAACFKRAKRKVG